MEREGTVIRVEGASCLVQLDAPPGEGAAPPLRCPIRRGARSAEQGPVRLAAGDRVRVDGDGAIAEVLARRSKLVRRRPEAHDRGSRAREDVVAANVDQLAIVVAARDPAWEPRFVDRLLVAAEKGALAPLLVLNKVDLVREPAARAALERDVEIYRKVGYATLLASAREGDGVGALALALRGRTTVFAGPSGAGKSSLLNAVEPGLRLRTGEVSATSGKGKHTTSAASLLPLAAGGFVVDTPGVREFGFYDVHEQELPFLFPDFAPFRGRCRYPDCSHTHEPGCAVRAAAAAGEIAPARYASYVRIRESIAAGAAPDHS